jgi:mono/diheme cytochrome c family protein
MTTRRRVLAAASIIAAGLTAAACGSEGISLRGGDSASVKRGAVLFAERCSGCHTMDVTGAEGGASRVHDRERPDGPNFNVRKETADSVLYAIRNGGFSSSPMPQNLVTGEDAQAVAEFVAKYSGSADSSQPSNAGETGPAGTQP